ncbi:hypothetical protein SUDANB120_04036 [Streptomyces sp. enrichment culture]
MDWLDQDRPAVAEIGRRLRAAHTGEGAGGTRAAP